MQHMPQKSEFQIKNNGIKYLPQLLRGHGGLHQDFLEIDFLVVSDRGE